ncbi:HAD family hydrolase [Sporolactobacillus spathodeae]|uniref:FMN phosphatase YigB (HAD superfamily) n=1 Tax=Sporolactobacillus spathodeae TaxID=1465502 RepID=A0ABS2QA63_9BACL|nr:HAD hydrolase family protein [Sporolactobacillus spathodeae]MBM7658668.1 FMN phosphatase YigB (HAD superfamily) [Sporolactobacillus spathodeae]
MQPNRSIRALVFDLDGTLLNSQKKVKERTQQALIQCAEMGLGLVYCDCAPAAVGEGFDPLQYPAAYVGSLLQWRLWS